MDRPRSFRRRRIFGPGVLSVATYGVAQFLNGRFEAENPAFRGIPATTVVWVSIVVTLVVIATWCLALSDVDSATTTDGTRPDADVFSTHHQPNRPSNG